VQMTPWERSGYRRGLRKAILKNQDAMFHALVHEHDSGLNSQLARFLMDEAEWDVNDFMTSYVRGELDG